MIVGLCAQCLGITSESAFWTWQWLELGKHAPLVWAARFFTQRNELVDEQLEGNWLLLRLHPQVASARNSPRSHISTAQISGKTVPHQARVWTEISKTLQLFETKL